MAEARATERCAACNGPIFYPKDDGRPFCRRAAIPTVVHVAPGEAVVCKPMAEATHWPNGVPKISDERRAANLYSPDALRDLIFTLWLYIGRYEETQLTTEQKELLADVVAAERDDEDNPLEYDRWWRGEARRV